MTTDQPLGTNHAEEHGLRTLTALSTRLGVSAVFALVDGAEAVLDKARGEQARPAAPSDGPGTPTAALEPARPAGPDLRDVIVGAVFEAEDRLFDGAERVGRAMGRVAPVGRWVLAAPVFGPARRWADAQVSALAARGAAERAKGAEEAGRAVSSTVDGVVGSDAVRGVATDAVGELIGPILDDALPVAIEKLGDRPELIAGLVDGLLDGILDSALPVAIEKLGKEPELLEGLVGELIGPILDDALPVAMDKLADQPELIGGLINKLLDPILDEALPSVLDKLNEEPEVVRDLVMGQSTTMATEMANNVRSRTVAADDLVERFARKLTLRKSRPALPPRGSDGGLALPAGGESSAGDSPSVPALDPADRKQVAP